MIVDYVTLMKYFGNEPLTEKELAHILAVRENHDPAEMMIEKYFPQIYLHLMKTGDFARPYG